MKKQPHDNICGAKTRAGTPCKQKAGWGTHHVGTGRCKLHGGSSRGAPGRNKNAVTTGEHETIYIDALDDIEKKLYSKVDIDKLVQLDSEIRLTEIRIRRMMHRIKKMRERDKEMVAISHKSGTERDRETNITERSATILQIQAIEEALTRVQGHKARLIDLKHKLETDMGLDDADKANIKEFIEASRPQKAEITLLFGDEADE